MIERFDVENGSHWKAPELALHETIAQWLAADIWVLMTAPYRAGPNDGPYRTAQMPISDPDGSGKVFYTRDELAARLERYGYTRIDGRTVTVVDASRDEQSADRKP